MADVQEITISDVRESASLTGFVQAFVFVLVLAAGFILLAKKITDLQGGGVSVAAEGVNPDRGESIFWGTGPVNGTCSTCHSIGSRGNMTRCPNQGDDPKLGPIMWERAILRARERTEQTGVEYTPTDYLVESIANPSGYIVKGFPDKLMPLVYTGQIDLSAEDVMAVVAYLQTLGGDFEIEEIQKSMSKFGDKIYNKTKLVETVPTITFLDPAWRILPLEKLEKYKALSKQEQEKFLTEQLTEVEKEDLVYEIEDWTEQGKKAYKKYKCFQCHEIKNEDFGPIEKGKVGPELTTIGDIQPIEYMVESLLNPSALIVPPLEQNADEKGKSKMPEFADSVNLQDFQYLVFYLTRLKATVEAKSQ